MELCNHVIDKFTLPPSPSWQLSNILACNDNGLLACGAMNDVTIIEVKKEGNFVVSFINLAHKENVRVLVFSPITGNFKNCLATCGDDGVVLVWNFINSSLLFRHEGHKDGQRVQGLDWSRADTNRLVSINEVGSIVVWDLASNTIRKLHCGAKVLPLCLACSPHDKNLVAVGCKAGITLVIDIKGNGKLLHRLRGHDQDVISISWCPVPFNVFKYKRSNEENNEEKNEKTQELLLATGGIDKTIFIWRTSSDGRFEIALNLPNNSVGSGSQRRKTGMNGQMMTWTCVLWVDAYTLLSTSLFGELLSWDLNRVSAKEKSKNTPQLLHSRHYKGCFSIACPTVYDEVIDHKADQRVVWTTAMDKHIVGCSLTTGNIVLDIPTLGGTVFCMASSPLDPNRLAIGSSDRKVFVWNMSDINALNFDCYWRKIVGKVMTLCWHPTEENWLAYGTSDGHVGLLDVGSNKLPTILRLHHRKSVYRLCWAPPLLGTDEGSKEKAQKLVLYSAGDKDVLQYTANLQKPDEEPKSLNAGFLNGIAQSMGFKNGLPCSEISFKPDNTCFVVGCENGTFYTVDCETKALKQTVYAHKKLVNSLEWHPETVASDNNISPYKNWLASCSDTVKVHNMPLEGQPELVATFSSHSEKVVGIAWSPHFNGRLVSCSYDCTAQVWDVPNQSCLGMYTGHRLPVMSVLFSPEDPDLVLSGSTDSTLRIWPISKLPVLRSKPEKKKDRISEILKLRSTGDKATELATANQTVNGKNVAAYDLENHDANCDNSTQSNSSQNNYITTNENERGGGKKGAKKQKVLKRSMFPTTESNLTQSQHFDEHLRRWSASKSLTNDVSSSPQVNTLSDNQEQKEELNYLDFFGDNKAMHRLMEREEKYMKDNKNYSGAYLSGLWQGANLTEMIKEAITKKTLSEWLISIAPIVGFDMWEQACEAYASQLVECGDIINASSYLLAIHKVHEAVKLLAEHQLYREAIAAAKCRLSADDPLIATIYQEWGDHADLQGRLSAAAHCYLAANDTEACIGVLSRNKDLKSLKMAAKLANHLGQTEMANSLALDCLTSCARFGNHSVGLQVAEELPQYQYWAVLLRASEEIAKAKERSVAEVLKRLDGQVSGQSPLLDQLSAVCAPHSVVYDKLLPHLSTNNTPVFNNDMWLYVTGQLAAACAARQEKTPLLFLRHLLAALSAAFHYETYMPTDHGFPIIITLMMPNGIFAKDSIILENFKTEEEIQLMKSVKAFVCAGLMLWMNNNWKEIEELQAKKNTSDVNGVGNTDDNSVADSVKFNWLPDLIANLCVDVLDSGSVGFFVKRAQKKQLEESVADLNIKKNLGRRFKNLSEIKYVNEKTYDHCESESEQGSKDIKTEIENTKVVDTTQTNTEVSETSCNGNKFEKEVPQIKLDQSDIDRRIQKCIRYVDTQIIVPPPCEKIESIEADICLKVEEIRKLNKDLQKFEAERVSAPSPFIAYTNVKFLIDKVVRSQDATKAQHLHDACDELWKKSRH